MAAHEQLVEEYLDAHPNAIGMRLTNARQTELTTVCATGWRITPICCGCA